MSRALAVAEPAFVGQFVTRGTLRFVWIARSDPAAQKRGKSGRHEIASATICRERGCIVSAVVKRALVRRLQTARRDFFLSELIVQFIELAPATRIIGSGFVAGFFDPA